MYGSLLPVVIWDAQAMAVREKQFREGDYVFLKNLKTKSSKLSGFLEAAMSSNKWSGVYRVSLDNPEVEKLTSRQATKTLLSKERTSVLPPASSSSSSSPATASHFSIPSSSSSSFLPTTTMTTAAHPQTPASLFVTPKDPITRILAKNVQPTNIAGILRYPVAVYKFVLNAAVVDYQPREIRSFSRAYCDKCQRELSAENVPPHCPHCNHSPPNGFPFHFIFSLLLEDETGFLNVIAYGKDGDALLGSQAATNLFRDQRAFEEVERKVRKLCPNPGTKGSGKLCNFCIKSFSPKDSGLRSYRVFDTSTL